MRMGTAARRWQQLAPSADQYQVFRDTLQEAAGYFKDACIELCYSPFCISDALRGSLEDPPATLLVLPNGWVKVAAALPYICADLRRHSLAECWSRYRAAWRDLAVTAALRSAIDDESCHAQANSWQMLPTLS
jgi:hypothetical protein